MKLSLREKGKEESGEKEVENRKKGRDIKTFYWVFQEDNKRRKSSSHEREGKKGDGE